MEWIRYGQASGPVFENHTCQCLLESFNVPLLLKLRMKFVEAGISVERVTDDVKHFESRISAISSSFSTV
jgi:hypothetical protein